MDDDAQTPRDTNLIIVLLVLMAVTFFLCRHFGRSDLALSSCVPLMGAGSIIRMRWNLIDRLWFWTTILFVALVHIPLIFAVQFPHIIVNRVTLLPIGLVDYLLYYGAVNFVERFIVKPVASSEDA